MKRKGCGAHRKKNQELDRAALRFARLRKRLVVPSHRPGAFQQALNLHP